MSKRNFGAIKCLLHFDYPYFNEPGDGLGDEVGLETWSKENDNVKLYGSVIPNAGSRAPKFGYRCLYPYNGAVIGTNNTGIWNMNSSGNYEIEFFVYPVKHGTDAGTRRLLRLRTNGSTESIFMLSLTTSGCLELTATGWGITEALTGTTALSVKIWHHVLIRVSDQKVRVFLDSAEELIADIPENVALSVDHVRLGYFTNTTYAFYMDEFVFRHAAGNDAPVIPTEPYNGVLDVSQVGGIGDGSDGNVVLSSDTQLNSTATIRSVTDSKTFTTGGWNNGSYTATVGRELMIHLYSGNNPLLGCYAFARIDNIEDKTITLDRDITTDNGDDFTLSSELLTKYAIQVITVPNFTSLTVNAGKRITPCSCGVVAFRCTDDCTINGSIITHGSGIVRSDTMQITHSKLIEHFVYSQGGGIFIACGGTFTAPKAARLGATWSGLGDSSNGAAGYGGNGGGARPSSSVLVSGSKGGVGGGGGGAACSGTSLSAIASGGAAGSTGSSATTGGGGGGCGGSGGTGSSYAGGSGGGGQGGSGGAAGIGKATSSSTNKGEYGANGVNGGNCGFWDTNYNSSTSYTYYYSGAGGGGPGGNGGYGHDFKSVNAYNHTISEGIAGASIILICNKLAADEAALSTGGAAGETRAFESGYVRIGGAGGGGTGFCYIACNERVSA